MLGMVSQVNWLAVLVCAVLSMVIGFIWYGPLFSKQWSALTGWTNEKVAALGQSALMRSYGLAFVSAFVFASALALILRGLAVSSIADGLITGAVLWVGLIATSIGVNMVFERRSTMLFIIEAGYHLATILVYSVILTLWR